MGCWQQQGGWLDVPCAHGEPSQDWAATWHGPRLCWLAASRQQWGKHPPASCNAKLCVLHTGTRLGKGQLRHCLLLVLLHSTHGVPMWCWFDHTHRHLRPSCMLACLLPPFCCCSGGMAGAFWQGLEGGCTWNLFTWMHALGGCLLLLAVSCPL